MKHSFSICLVVLTALVLAAGCTYRVQVRGYKSPEPELSMAPGMSIHVMPEDAMLAGACPVAGNEMTRMIGELAAEHGYTIAPAEEADLYLVFSYDHMGYRGRVRFEPHSGPTSGMKTVGRGGPFDHRIWLRVVDARGYRVGQENVIWVGSASLNAAPTSSARFVAMLLVAVFEDFPGQIDETVTRRMTLSDSRIVALGY